MSFRPRQEEKAKLRERLREVLGSLPHDIWREGSERVTARVLGLECFRESGVVVVYAALRAEIDVQPLARQALALGKRVAIPRIDGSVEGGEQGMHAAEILEWDRDLVRGPRGALQPRDGCAEIVLGERDLVVVPGLAFDGNGSRLGRGGGFYDRLLGGLSVRRVGVCLDEQVVSSVPGDERDAQVEMVVTPTRVIVAHRA